MTTVGEECVTAWVDACNIPGWFDWIAGVLGLAGLIFAIVQLCRSSNALQAARRSYEKTRASLALNQMLLNHGDLEAHSNALDRVLDVVDREPAFTALQHFAKRASELAALLEIASEEHEQTVIGLRNAAKSAEKGIGWLTKAQRSLVNEQLAGQAATDMRQVVTNMAGTIATLRNSPMTVESKGRKR